MHFRFLLRNSAARYEQWQGSLDHYRSSLSPPTFFRLSATGGVGVLETLLLLLLLFVYTTYPFWLLKHLPRFLLVLRSLRCLLVRNTWCLLLFDIVVKRFFTRISTFSFLFRSKYNEIVGVVIRRTSHVGAGFSRDQLRSASLRGSVEVSTAANYYLLPASVLIAHSRVYVCVSWMMKLSRY